MTKDYAKRRPAKKKSKKKMTMASLVLLLLVVVIVVGFVVWMMQGKETALPPVVEATPVKKVLPKKLVAKSVEYQFYTLLPSMKVESSLGHENIAPGASSGYWLQMAVYYAEKDAASMIERLQLQGLMPQIAQRQSETSQKMLYMVVLGPYATKPEAIKAQQALLKQGLNNMIFYVPAKPKADTA